MPKKTFPQLFLLLWKAREPFMEKPWKTAPFSMAFPRFRARVFLIGSANRRHSLKQSAIFLRYRPITRAMKSPISSQASRLSGSRSSDP